MCGAAATPVSLRREEREKKGEVMETPRKISRKRQKRNAYFQRRGVVTKIADIERMLKAREPSETSSGTRVEAFDTLSKLMTEDAYKRDAFSAVRVVKALLNTARVSRGHRRSVEQYIQESQFLSIWQDKLRGRLGELDHRALSSVIHVLGALGVRPSEQFLTEWETATEQFLRWDAQGLCNTANALAKLQLQPSAELRESLLRAFVREKQQQTPRAVATFAWAVGKLQWADAGGEFWDALERVLVAHVAEMTADELTKVIWCYGRVRRQLAEEVLCKWNSRFYQVCGRMDARGLVDCLNALAHSGAQQPKEDFLHVWFECFDQKLALADQRTLALVLAATNRLQIELDAPFCAKWEAALQTVLPEISARATANSYWGVWRHYPAYARETSLPAFEHEFSNALVANSSTDALSVQQVVDCLWALGKAELRPSEEFMSTWYGKYREYSEVLSAQHLAAIAWAVARLKLQAGEQFWETWHEAFERERLGVLSAHVSLSFWAFGELGLAPPESFLRELYRVFEAEQNDLSCQVLANCIHSFAQLSVIDDGGNQNNTSNTRPQPAFLSQWFAAFARADSSRFEPQELSSVLWSIAKLDVAPVPEEFLAQWERGFHANIEMFEAHQLGTVMWAFGHMNATAVLPTRECITAWTWAFVRTAAHANHQTLANSMWAFGRRLEMKPRAEFLDAWTAAWLESMREMSSQELINSMWGLARVEHKPNASSLSLWFDCMLVKMMNTSGSNSSSSSINPHELASALYAVGKLQVEVPDEFLAAWMAQFYASAELFTVKQLAVALWALARLDVALDQDFRTKWCALFGAKVDDIQQHDAVMSTWAMKKYDMLL
uniref:Uncharacterized protein n=1 Tax=Erythrolobus madagascarensis TaxID=708628 RepID=A0A7S0T7Y7_9RHOD